VYVFQFGVVRCRDGNARKIMMRECAHLNLVLCGVKLARIGKIILRRCVHYILALRDVDWVVHA
jgi:hypothetical protein